MPCLLLCIHWFCKGSSKPEPQSHTPDSAWHDRGETGTMSSKEPGPCHCIEVDTAWHGGGASDRSLDIWLHGVQGQAEFFLEKLHGMTEKQVQAFIDGNNAVEGWAKFRESIIGLTDVTRTHFEKLVSVCPDHTVLMAPAHEHDHFIMSVKPECWQPRCMPTAWSEQCK